MSTLDLSIRDGIAHLVLARADGPNRVDAAFVTDLHAALDRLAAAAQAAEAGGERLHGVLLTSAQRDFCVGADLRWLLRETDPAAFYAAGLAFTGALRRLETLGVPVAAVLAGSALGGGYEIALAAHHLVAVDSRKIRIGLPEVGLGVIPGAGGTVRLTRRIGVQPALQLMAGATTLPAPKALEQGLVDALSPSAEAAEEAAISWLLEHPNARQPWDDKAFRFADLKPGTAQARDLFMAAQAVIIQRTSGAYRAPEALLSVVQEGTLLPFDRAIEREGRAFAKLASSHQSKDMVRTLFFHKSAAEKGVGLPALPAGEGHGIRKVAVLGAGMMGAGLAGLAAAAGYETVLKDISQAALDAGMAHIDKALAANKRLDDAGRAAARARVLPTLHNADVAGADLVIEAVIEKMSVKHAVLAELEGTLAPGAIWASNTSALPITQLAAPSAAPDRFVGLHFFSPVEKMPLVEVIRGEKSGDEALARAIAFCREIGKTAVLVHDGVGFFTTRVFASYILEAVELLAEGHAPATIEWAAKSAGMVVPPLQVFDETTLTLGLHVLDDAARLTGHDQPAARRVLEVLIAEGRTGRSGGKGFYAYEGDKPGGKRVGLWEGLARFAAGTPADTSLEYVQRRLLLAQAVAAAGALSDGVVRSPADGDVMAILGIGFAPNTGGPFAWLDRQEPELLVEELEGLVEDGHSRFAPPAVLRERAASGARFYAP